MKTERHNLKSTLEYVSKNACEWNSNPCLYQPETYPGIKVAAILERRKVLDQSAVAACQLLQPQFQSTPLVGAGMVSNPTRSRFLLIYVEANLSFYDVLSSVFNYDTDALITRKTGCLP